MVRKRNDTNTSGDHKNSFKIKQHIIFKMTITQFVNRTTQEPQTIEFEDTMAIIEKYYDFTPTAFTNGTTQNEAGQNSGSCKLFFFAKLNNLNIDQTLACFGKYYREDVLKHPDANDHQNIRNFIKSGWDGISFSQDALQLLKDEI